MIRFLAPWWLFAVIPVLLLAGIYVWRQLHRRSYAIRFSNVDLLRTVAPGGIGTVRRHAPAVALLLSLFVLALALARPAADTRQPLERATVMLALDTSLSMMADDVSPTRLAAAQEAAKDFVAQLPDEFNVGLVAFAKAANVVVPPTKDHAAVVAAIDGLQLAESTATGEAVFTCLDAIAAIPADGAEGPPPARIVLLSDGYRTYGRSVEEAGAAASVANVPVSTIAFGTDEGVVVINGSPQRVPVDRAALEMLAESTHGHFYEAATAEALRQVYEDMGSSIGYRTVAKEIWVWFLGAGLLFALGAAAMSLLWTSRLV
ncbi:MAG TPA: VWA domain-containing protein [Micromonosporaceae bacterium]|nr:VWA domain-containing protein [Micromonosporaceae bacterium]